MEKYAHKSDCDIIREGKEKRLYDSEGDTLFCFPLSWTDKMIWEALKFANKAYSKGVQWGECKKINEVKSILEL